MEFGYLWGRTLYIILNKCLVYYYWDSYKWNNDYDAQQLA